MHRIQTAQVSTKASNHMVLQSSYCIRHKLASFQYAVKTIRKDALNFWHLQISLVSNSSKNNFKSFKTSIRTRVNLHHIHNDSILNIYIYFVVLLISWSHSPCVTSSSHPPKRNLTIDSQISPFPHCIFKSVISSPETNTDYRTHSIYIHDDGIMIITTNGTCLFLRPFPVLWSAPTRTPLPSVKPIKHSWTRSLIPT